MNSTLESVEEYGMQRMNDMERLRKQVNTGKRKTEDVYRMARFEREVTGNMNATVNAMRVERGPLFRRGVPVFTKNGTRKSRLSVTHEVE